MTINKNNGMKLLIFICFKFKNDYFFTIVYNTDSGYPMIFFIFHFSKIPIFTQKTSYLCSYKPSVMISKYSNFISNSESNVDIWCPTIGNCLMVNQLENTWKYDHQCKYLTIQKQRSSWSPYHPNFWVEPWRILT